VYDAREIWNNIKRSDSEMNMTRRFAHVVLVIVMVLGAVCLASAQNPSDVVSVINGEKITRAEMQDKVGGRLLQPRYDLYQAEQKALDEFIAQRLLEIEARRQNLTVDELLKREVNSKVADPTEDQLRAVYEVTNAASQPFDTVKDKLLEFVRTARQTKARIAYIDALRAKSDVLILLAPPRTEVAVGDAPRSGPANAPVQLVEFADYECPYCIKVYPIVKKLKEEFGDRVSFVFKNLPLPMHAHAQKAAEGALCAAAQNKFWDYYNRLFTSTNLDVPAQKQFASELKLDTGKFDLCLDSGAQVAAVQKDAAEAQKLGLSATPSFFLNGHFFTGAVDYNSLRQMVLQELSAAEKGKGKQPVAAKEAGE
jgi:protein-disulfide isomerase